jgi:hypothetical protein
MSVLSPQVRQRLLDAAQSTGIADNLQRAEQTFGEGENPS